MSDETKQFAIRIAVAVAALLVIGMGTLFATMLYTGAAIVPGVVQMQIWSLVTVALVAASIFINGWISNRNASKTQGAVAEVKHEVLNGLVQRMGDNVDATAQKTAETLRTSTLDIAAALAASEKTRQEMALINQKIDALIMGHQSLPASAPVVVGDQARVVDAIKETTAAVETVAENTMPPKSTGDKP